MLPNDPYMLLSFINMKLRDGERSLEALCEDEDTAVEEITAKLVAIGYIYNEKRRAFVAM